MAKPLKRTILTGKSPPPTALPLKRGEIYYADLSRTIGSEVNKLRPVLVVSNNANNRAANTITILPITSNITRVFAFEVALAKRDSGLTKDSKAQAQQIRTIAKERLRGKALGSLSAELMRRINAAIKLHLALD
jgi:mRNA interferase MazF